MQRMALGIGLVLAMSSGIPVVGASSADLALTAAVPARTMVASSVLSTAPAVHDDTANRFRQLEAVDIVPRSNPPSPRSASVGLVMAPGRADGAVKSSLIVRDIQPSRAVAPRRQGIATVAFGRSLPSPDKALAVEVRTIERHAGSASRVLVAQNDTDTPEVGSTEELHDVLQEVRSPGGRSGVVSVEIGTSPKAKPAPPVRRMAPQTSSADSITIVGHRGEGIHEIQGGEARVLDDAPAINRINAGVTARMDAARDALAERNEGVEEAKEELQEDAAEAVEEGERGGERIAAPKPRQDQEMVRRYDWRKGIFVTVPKDAPPVPDPGVSVEPAQRVERNAPRETGTVLRGKIPRGPSGNPSGEEPERK